jgi:hypothetical protein
MSALTDLEAKVLAKLTYYGAAIPFTGGERRPQFVGSGLGVTSNSVRQLITCAAGTKLEILPVLCAAFAAAFYLFYALWSFLPITAGKG